jgi:hypothetical protein
MKKSIVRKFVLEDYLGCYGNFNRRNPICKKFCAVNLRCAIEQDQNVRYELLEDMVVSEELGGRMN